MLHTPPWPAAAAAQDRVGLRRIIDGVPDSAAVYITRTYDRAGNPLVPRVYHSSCIMVTCCHEDCSERACFGVEGSKPVLCARHAEKGMINLK